jgi:hypothetical protein
MAQSPLVPETKSTARTATGSDTEHIELEVASQWKLMWWKFKRHRLAMVGGIVVLIYYIVAIFANFFAPVYYTTYNAEYVYAPPQQIHLFRDGKVAPYVYGYRFERDPVSYKKTWIVDKTQIIPVGLFVHGESYKLLGFIPTNIHLLGPKNLEDPSYDPFLSESYHRHHHTGYPRHDPGRDRPQLSGLGSASAGCQLGCHAPGNAKSIGAGPVSLAIVPCSSRDHRCPGAKFPGGWPA